MPEILKPRTDTRKEVKCKRCGALIGYYDTETKPFILPGRVGCFSSRPSRILFNYIVCPSCGCDIRTDK